MRVSVYAYSNMSITNAKCVEEVVGGNFLAKGITKRKETGHRYTLLSNYVPRCKPKLVIRTK